MRLGRASVAGLFYAPVATPAQYERNLRKILKYFYAELCVHDTSLLLVVLRQSHRAGSLWQSRELRAVRSIDGSAGVCLQPKLRMSSRCRGSIAVGGDVEKVCSGGGGLDISSRTPWEGPSFP